MVSSSAAKKEYPPLLFEESKAPRARRSMNHNCHLVNVTRIREELGEDVWLDLHKSPLGPVSKFCEIHFIFWAKIIHYLLTHQLVSDVEHELWAVVQGRPIRFSLHEFSDITRLNCDPFSGEEKADTSHTEFWKEIGVPSSQGPCLDEVLAAFPKCKLWSFEKRRMLAWLCILSVVIFGVSHSTRIPLEYARLVLDPERFTKFPWGRVAFTCLLDGVRMADIDERKTYNVRGFVHVLQIWALESVPGLGEAFGNRRQGEDVPLLSWNGSRPHFDWPKFVDSEIEKHGKLRVRSMIVKPAEEIYPVWDGKTVEDSKVGNLIQDIILDQIDEGYWEEVNVKDKAPKKRKKELQSSNDEEGNGVKITKKREW